MPVAQQSRDGFARRHGEIAGPHRRPGAPVVGTLRDEGKRLGSIAADAADAFPLHDDARLAPHRDTRQLRNGNEVPLREILPVTDRDGGRMGACIGQKPPSITVPFACQVPLASSRR